MTGGGQTLATSWTFDLWFRQTYEAFWEDLGYSSDACTDNKETTTGSLKQTDTERLCQ
jgi:hypothetical protein